MYQHTSPRSITSYDPPQYEANWSASSSLEAGGTRAASQ